MTPVIQPDAIASIFTGWRIFPNQRLLVCIIRPNHLLVSPCWKGLANQLIVRQPRINR